MFSFITRHFSNDIAIDLGTANTLIYVKGKGIVLDEPSVVAISEEGGANKVIIKRAVGKEAKLMLGKVPESIKTVRPMCDGVIADYSITEMMIKDFIHKVHPNRFFNPSPIMVIGVPCGSTPVEKKAIYDAARESGAREVHLIPEPMAAAIGAGMPVNEASGSMIIDIGGGTTEVAIISLGGTVYSNSVRVGGDKFDDAIINYVRRNYGMLIGESTAETIKKSIGMAFPDSKVIEKEIKGRKISEGIPRSLTITSNEILEALSEPLNAIVNAVKQALEVTPPELGADIAERGMMISSGGALLKNIDILLREETGLPVHIAENPLTCVVRGLGSIVENISHFEKGRNALY